MTAEHRFVLANFRCMGPAGTLKLYEAGRSYPMPPVIALAAAKRGLVARAKPPAWARPGLQRRADMLTAADIVATGVRA